MNTVHVEQQACFAAQEQVPAAFMQLCCDRSMSSNLGVASPGVANTALIQQ